MSIRTPQQAEAWLLALKTNQPGTCQMVQRKANDVDSNGDATAFIDYEHSTHKHGPNEKPWPGVKHRWGPKPGSPDGHVAHACSDDPTDCISTDWPTEGHIGRVSVAELTRAWGLPYLGFTEDIDGVVVAPKPTPAPVGPETRGKHVDAALASLKTAAKNAKPGTARHHKITAAIDSLHAIEAKRTPSPS